MINVYKFESETEEDVRLKAFDELDVYENEVISKVYEEEGMFKIEIIKKEEIREYIENYFKELSSKLNINMKISIYEEEGIYNVKINSKANSILIGKDGRTMMAIQILLRQSIRNLVNFNIKVNLDVSNYKNRKEKDFEIEIKKIINDVLISKMETKLDPMNSYQRRIVHSVASNYYNIKTESIGEEPNRYTIIKYVD